MEVKHIVPAYSPAGHGEEQDSRLGKIESFILKIKNIGKKFGKKSSRDRFSPKKTPRFNTDREGSLKDKLPNIDKKSLIKWGVITIASAGILVAGARYINNSPSAQNSNSNDQERVEVKGATATQDINKEFAFPIRNSEGEEVGDLKYTIQSAELREEILVQGQKATAIEGRIFLIISIKLTNENTVEPEIDTRDYLRLSVNGNDQEWLAPDIHNDPVAVQPISTKYTRVGFAINEDDEEIVLRVGEISGEKETIDIDL